MLAARGPVSEPRVALETFEPERAAERGPVRRRGRADDEVSVRGAHRLVRPDELVRRARGARDLAGREVGAGLPHRERHGRLEHRHIDHLAASVALAHRERAHDPDRRVEAGGEVGDRDAHLDRRATWLAGDAHEPAHRLDDDVERGAIGVRAVQSPAGHRRVDEAWVPVEQLARIEAEVAHRAGPQVLDDDVRARGQPPEHVLPCLGLEIERDAALRPIEPHEVAALAVHHRLEPAREIATARILDLHDVGTEIRELHAAERAGHVVADLEHAEAIQRRGHPGESMEARCAASLCPPSSRRSAARPRRRGGARRRRPQRCVRRRRHPGRARRATRDRSPS